MKATLFIAALVALVATSFSQTQNVYEVFAIRFAGPWFSPMSEIAVGVNSKDSVEGCNMVWLLRGSNGRNVLVDAGFLGKDSISNDGKYTRPDLALAKMNVGIDEVTDVIITHPHYDHIGGIDLFRKAMVWMQKDDFDYFVGSAWQKNGFSEGFGKKGVRQIVEINLQGRLTLVKGDSLEIIPGIRVFIGSKHTWESQYVLVNSKTDQVLIASDNIWFYYNLNNLVSIPKYTFDAAAYVGAMKRMKTLVSNIDLIIPGHDAKVFSKFTRISEGIVKIR